MAMTAASSPLRRPPMPSQTMPSAKLFWGAVGYDAKVMSAILVLLANGADACCKADISRAIDRIGRFVSRGDEACDTPLKSVGHFISCLPDQPFRMPFNPVSGRHPSGASSKPENWNAGATVHPSSAYAPSGSAACQRFAGTTACATCPRANDTPSTVVRTDSSGSAMYSASGSPTSKASTRCQRERSRLGAAGNRSA